MDALAGAALLVGAYLVGAIPSGVILGRIFSDTDLRDHGSGSTGTTNAYRVLGWRISVAVLVLDFVKGLLPVLIAKAIGAGDWVTGAVAVATVIGHCWSPFIRFHGGKGMATGAGSAAGLLPWVLLVFPVMLVVVGLTRYVSLASITGSVLAGTALVALAFLGSVEWSIALATAAIVSIIIVQHRTNIERLRAGTERRLVRSTADGKTKATRSA